MLVRGVNSARPEQLGFCCFAIEVFDARSLVKVVSTLANEGHFHTVVLVEVLLVVLDEEFTDLSKDTLALGDWFELQAATENLNQG